MNCIIVFYLTVFGGLCINAELEYYPGFRRPNPIINWEKERAAEEYALEQLTEFLRERQRLAEQEEAAVAQRPRPEFTFHPDLSRARTYYYPKDPGDVFAVAPPDSRYYEPAPDDFYIPDYDTDSEIRSEPVQKVQPVQKIEPILPKPKPKPTTVQVVQRSEEQISHLQNIPLRQQTVARLLQASPGAGGIAGQEAVFVKPVLQDDTAGVYIIAVVAGISAAATVGLIAFGIGWYNLQKNVKNASDVEYPAYGVTGPNKDVSPTGDRRLAQSAQMYHYQHQKQQIIAMERTAASDRHGSLSEADSDEENEEGDYTVYECPGLAPTGEMEVKNPLFQDDTTPAVVTSKQDEQQNQK